MEETIQYLQIATNIIIILLFIGLVILVFNLIKSLKVVMSKFDDISGQVKSIKSKIEPAVEKIQSLTENVNSVVDKVKNNVDVLEKVVERIKDTTDSIINFEQKIQRKIEPPVTNTVNIISAISVGIKTFFERLKNNRDDKFYTADEIEEVFDLEEETINDVNKELDEVNSKLSDLQK